MFLNIILRERRGANYQFVTQSDRCFRFVATELHKFSPHEGLHYVVLT